MAHTGLFMLRVAGLPVGTVSRLRCPATADWADEVLGRESALRARGAELSDLLHGLVKANDDVGSRRALLALRRRVFGNTLPPDPAAAAAMVSTLDPEIAGQLTAWLTDRRELADLTAGGAARLADDLAASRGELRQIATEQRLQCGLPLASPTLAGQVRLLPGPETIRPGKRARRVERSILSYLYRTACKTSPFSTFTGVTLGRDAPAGEETGRVRVPEEWSSHVRLNVVAIGRLADAIIADPLRRGDLPVELASGWRHDDERVRYVRRWVRPGDDSSSVSFDAAREHLFFLRRSGLLDRLIDLFASSAPLRCGDVVRWLVEQEAAAPDECERYLSTLLDLGMLRVRGLDIDVHAGDPLRALRDALLRLDRAWATDLAGRLAAPIGLVDAYPGMAAEGRRRLLAELRADLRQTLQVLGAQEAALPQALLYEDARAGEVPLRLDLGAWMGLVGADLRAVERILPVFDPTVAHRITFKGFFLARYGQGGRCDDVLRLVADFHEDFYDQYVSFTAGRRPFELDGEGEYVPEENWMALPGIAVLDDARRLFIDHMRQLWAGVAGSGAEEIRLDRKVVERIADRLTPIAPRAVAHSHFLQFVARDCDPLVVLNQTYGGLSFAFSRFTHCFDADDGLSEWLRRVNRGVEPAGAVFAEITGGAATTNLNLHGRLTDYEIVSPGESSCAPADRQIPLDDLYVEHDAERDRLVLRSRRLGREVIPLYFGYLIPAALPEVPRTLLLLSPTSMGRLDVWSGVTPAGAAADGEAATTRAATTQAATTRADTTRADTEPADEMAAVTEWPRVRLGGLVLSRRCWHARAGDLPALTPSEHEHEWYLDWRRWWRAHDLPPRVFATVHQAGAPEARLAKPQYLDIDSYLSLAAFAGLIGSAEDRVILREMLPTSDDLHVDSARGEHVAELAVQTIGGADER